MGTGYQIFWPGQTHEELEKIGDAYSSIWGSLIYLNGEGGPFVERFEEQILAFLELFNPDPLEWGPERTPWQWAAPEEVSALLAPFAEALRQRDPVMRPLVALGMPDNPDEKLENRCWRSEHGLFMQLIRELQEIQDMGIGLITFDGSGAGGSWAIDRQNKIVKSTP